MCDIMYINYSGSLILVFKNDWAMGGSGFRCMVRGGEGILPFIILSMIISVMLSFQLIILVQLLCGCSIVPVQSQITGNLL